MLLAAVDTLQRETAGQTAKPGVLGSLLRGQQSWREQAAQRVAHLKSLWRTSQH